MAPGPTTTQGAGSPINKAHKYGGFLIKKSYFFDFSCEKTENM